MKRKFLLALGFIITTGFLTTANGQNWSSVSGGDSHTIAIKTDGTLWAWGYNGYGQLGLGDYTDRSSPTQVGTLTTWASVSGACHTIAIKTDGTLWAWGYNNSGQLGLGDNTDRTTPTRVGTDTNWSSVSGGDRNTLAIKTDGTLWAWGRNLEGKLGLGDTTNRYIPTQVGTLTNWASVYGWYCTIAIKTDGTLWAWGYNNSGQLGLGDTTNRYTPTQVGTLTNWASISGGYDHTLAIKTDGTLWAWGSNGAGQLGLGDNTNRNTPTQVGTLTNWASISGGVAHTLAIKTDRTLWAWGRNYNGQLGLGDYTNRSSPTQVTAAQQTGSISGKVTKSADGTAISGALVESLRSGVIASSTTSDTSGNYSTTIATGTYDVRITATGYQFKVYTDKVVLTGQTTTVDCLLEKVGETIQWDKMLVGVGPSNMTDCTLGDGRNDGFRRVYGANVDSNGYEFTWSGSSWTRSSVLEVGGAPNQMWAPVVGDARNDGLNRVYAGVGAVVKEFSWNGSNWTMAQLGGGGAYMSDVTIGEGRNDGQKRVYVAGSDHNAYEFSWTGSIWSQNTVGTTGADNKGVAVGDGRNDGVKRVYLASNDFHVYEFTWNGTVWTKLDMGSNPNESWGIAIGQGRNDGVNRIYAGCSDKNIYEFTWNGSNWGKTVVGAGGSYFPRLVVGNGRNDGTNRIYAANGDGYLYEFTWTVSSWNKVAIGSGDKSMSGVSIGIGRNDGISRVYAANFDKYFYEFTYVPPAAGNISGKVTKSDGSTAISGATVEALLSLSVIASTTTASDGTYQLINLSTGTYDVRASSTGYVTQTKTGYTVTAGATTTVDFALTEISITDFVTGQNAFLVLGQSNFTSNVTATTQNGMNNPANHTFDSSGNLWVTDGLNNRVLKFVPPFSNGMNASLVLGQSNFTSNTVATTQNGMSYPIGLAFDSSGNLWVAAFGNHRVLKFIPPFSDGMNASLVLGQSNFTSNTEATTQSGMSYPIGLAFDSSGNLWVAERSNYGNNRVLKFTPPFSNGMNASLVLGQSNFTSNTAATTQNGMNGPHSIAFDSSGNLWVGDFRNHRLLKYVPPFSNGMNASLVLGQSNFTSYIAATTQNGMSYPIGLAFDSPGNLWVADAGNHRVLKFVPPFSNGMNASLVLGQSNFTSNTEATTQSGMSYPIGLAFDSPGNLWVADVWNNRVLKFVPSVYTGSIAGKVTKSDGVTAIQGALVELLRSGVIASTTTKTDGTYQLINLSTGTYDVRASKSGYETQTKTGQIVTAGATTTVNFALVEIAANSQNWSSVSGGWSYTLARKTDGTLWAWGYNYYGQLGLGDETNRNEPTQVGTLTNWASVSAGSGHILARKTDGTLWAWGYNYYGQLGLGDTTNRNEPTQVGTLTNWASVSAGSYHTLAIKTDGTLWAWGYNEAGRLGLGDTTNRNAPTKVGTLTNWASVSAGGSHTLARKTDGTLWVWGNNSNGQLGLGDTTNRNEPTKIGTLTNWASVSAGGSHTLAIKTDGTLWAWGYNEFGQLGLGDTIDRWTPTQVGEAPPPTTGTMDLKNAKVYPNPFKPNDGKMETGDWARGIIFTNLTKEVDIVIYDVNGEEVTTLYKNDSNNEYKWSSVTDSEGNRMPSGLYYCVLKSGGEKKILRLVIIR